jgi:hypothetical protein
MLIPTLVVRLQAEPERGVFIINEADFDAAVHESPEAAETCETKPAKPLAKMNKAELLAKAAALNLAIPEGATNAAIIAALEAGSE